MAKYSFIYCNKCQEFYFDHSVDFGDYSWACGVCFTKNIECFQADSFAEMAQIERMYKIKKITHK